MVEGDPIRYAPKRAKNPITPVMPIINKIEKKYKLGMFQLIRIKLYSDN